MISLTLATSTGFCHERTTVVALTTTAFTDCVLVGSQHLRTQDSELYCFLKLITETKRDTTCLNYVTVPFDVLSAMLLKFLFCVLPHVFYHKFYIRPHLKVLWA